jgi:hypothetical protein
MAQVLSAEAFDGGNGADATAYGEGSRRQIHQVLDLGRVGRAVGEADRGKEVLRRVLIVELVAEDQRGTGQKDSTWRSTFG